MAPLESRLLTADTGRTIQIPTAVEMSFLVERCRHQVARDDRRRVGGLQDRSVGGSCTARLTAAAMLVAKSGWKTLGTM